MQSTCEQPIQSQASSRTNIAGRSTDMAFQAICDDFRSGQRHLIDVDSDISIVMQPSRAFRRKYPFYNACQPKISLRDYVHRISKFTMASHQSFVMACAYIVRLSEVSLHYRYLHSGSGIIPYQVNYLLNLRVSQYSWEQLIDGADPTWYTAMYSTMQRVIQELWACTLESRIISRCLTSAARYIGRKAYDPLYACKIIFRPLFPMAFKTQSHACVRSFLCLESSVSDVVLQECFDSVCFEVQCFVCLQADFM